MHMDIQAALIHSCSIQAGWMLRTWIMRGRITLDTNHIIPQWPKVNIGEIYSFSTLSLGELNST